MDIHICIIDIHEYHASWISMNVDWIRDSANWVMDINDSLMNVNIQLWMSIIVQLHMSWYIISFLAATKQLYEWFSPSVRLSVRPSVCPSVCLSHLFDYVPIILSSWNFQESLPVTKATSIQKVKVRGQRSSSQRSQPNLTVSGL